MDNNLGKIAKRNIVLYLSIAVIMISLTFSVSYAFFSAVITGNDTVTPVTVGNGKLNVNFTTSAYIDNSHLYLIKDNERATKAETTTFTINNNNNTGTVNAAYELYLTDLTITNNLKSADFKYELLINNEVKGSGSFLNATTGTDFKITSSVISIPYGQVDSCIFRIWLSETNEDQSDLISTSKLTRNQFSAKIRMDAVAGK